MDGDQYLWVEKCPVAGQKDIEENPSFYGKIPSVSQYLLK